MKVRREQHGLYRHTSRAFPELCGGAVPKASRESMAGEKRRIVVAQGFF